MTATQWLQRNARANGAHLAEASHALATSLHDAGEALARQGGSGMHAVRAFADEAVGNARQMGRSTRSLMVERPLEAALVAGIVGFAIGWLVRRSREGAARTAPQRTAAARTPRRVGVRGRGGRKPTAIG